jgi:hypothetical protein
MPFTDQDREKLSEVHTMVHSHLPRIETLEVKTDKIIGRQFHIMGFGAGVGAALTAVIGFFKT